MVNIKNKNFGEFSTTIKKSFSDLFWLTVPALVSLKTQQTPNLKTDETFQFLFLWKYWSFGYNTFQIFF